MDTFYNKKDFAWFKSNTDDILNRDIPSLKTNLQAYFDNLKMDVNKVTKIEQESIVTKEKGNPLADAQCKIEKIFNRFHLVVKEVSERYNNRTPLKMNDEIRRSGLARRVT
jgi:hypothetical protein